MCKPSPRAKRTRLAAQRQFNECGGTVLTSDPLQQEYVLTEADSPRAPELAVLESGETDTDGADYRNCDVLNSADLPQAFLLTSGMRDNSLPLYFEVSVPCYCLFLCRKFHCQTNGTVA